MGARKAALGVVARATESLLGLAQKSRFAGAVRLVTDGAILFDRRVKLGSLETRTFMTPEAQAPLGVRQEGGIVGSVWIVAAGARFDRRVAMFGFEPQTGGVVTVETELWFLLDEA